jgi:NAD-dependent dihydropyrimidine dehydrogenase PreA subunit
MAEDKKLAFFVDEDNCIGCGICVDSCPMKILALEDDICVMTDIVKCLECGTCIRDCPQDAITIPGVKLSPKEKGEKKGGASPAEAKNIPASQKFTPILQHLTDLIMQEVAPVQVFTHEGTDVTTLQEFDLEGESCFYRVYEADKLEKIGLSRMNFYGTMVADVVSITPGPAYDMPYYILDWDESDEHIFFICDLMPSSDAVYDLNQLQKYFYEPLEDLYNTYREVPGMKPSVFHWVRAIHSPYIITGTVEKTGNNIDMIYQCAVDYFNAWLKIYNEAQPQDPASEYMKRVHQRRKNIRELYRENDPGVGTLNKFLGDEMADASLAIIEP